MNKAIRFALWMALFGAMVGSVQHVAWSFSSIENNSLLWGYVQAVAVDVGIAALTFGVQRRKEQKRPTKLLWALMALFAGVSVYANLFYGFVHLSDVQIAPEYLWFANLRPFIMSAVLPIMVLSLAEVVSEDVRHEKEMLAKAERSERRRKQKSTVQTVQVDSELDTIERLTFAFYAFHSAQPLQ